MSWEDQIVECTPTEATKRSIRRGMRAHKESTREYGPSDEWDRRVIAQAIRAFALQGMPFSINDFRDLLPPVRTCLISRGFIDAQRDGLIEWRGRTTRSTLDSTKAAKVQVYVPLPNPARSGPRARVPQAAAPAPGTDVPLFDLAAS